ncbi:nuclear transport factor 2 family protein [Massilia endophytica]|uniref:nuclear transport factor 2 family protein n=1 Tax=Massilia endophytica TaxID=2899220 RepID=UPI001E57BF2C|nr:nuclear transport factor 2 family protein [Massilia endophytica]UGQ49087.1 tetratricopeptide repeat protein [Massilia endophytica]
MQDLQFSSRPLRRMGAALGLLALLCGPAARADEIADIGKLMRSGQLPAALQKTDKALAAQPRDPQLRFMKGLILAEQNRNNEAIAVFQKLTEDHPQLPEPYNNLAVLYAAAGQYDKARVALERAIRTNPAYATAHENLGDVYAKLASQAYDKAMQLLDSKDYAPPKSKLAMVRTLSSRDSTLAGLPQLAAQQAAPAPAKAAPAPVPPAAAAKTIAAAAPPPAPAAAPKAAATIPAPPAAPARTVAAAAAPVAPPPAPAKAAPPPAAPAKPAPVAPQIAAAQEVNAAAKQLNAAAQQANAVAPKPAPAAAAAKPLVAAQPPAPAPAPVQSPKAEPAKSDDSAEREAALKAVGAWAKAWSAQDMKGYLGAYAGSFQTPRGMSRQAWEADRRARIEGKEHIKVTVEAPQVTVKGNTATVRFRQLYVSDKLKANSRKTLIMEKQNGQWRIKQEQSGS